MPTDPAPDPAPPRDPLTLLGGLARSERTSLAALARREGLSPEDAVECVQEAFGTFLVVLRQGGAPPDAAGWPAYLAGVTRNLARNRRRRHHTARAHEPVDDTPSGELSIEELVAAAEEHVRLRACVARLCGTQRSVVTLRLLEERHGEDVAAALGISRAHVDVLLYRAKAELRSCMTE